MTDPTFSLKIDLNRDFDFTDPDEDLSNRLLAAHWVNGFGAAFDPLCADSASDFLLDNSDGRLSPERLGAVSGLDKGKTVTLDLTPSGGAPTRMWTGWVDHPAPTADCFGEQVTRLHCNGWAGRASNFTGWVAPIQLNKRVDQILPELLDRSGCYPPGLSGRVWLLDVPGLSELGVTTYLSDSSAYLTAETGGVTVALVGDQWNEQTSLLAAVREVVEREGLGRLWQGRDGKLNFWNRDHLFLKSTRDQTFDEAHPAHALDYDYASLLFNQATVNFANKQVGTGPEVLATYAAEIKLAPGQVKAIGYRYASPITGLRIGGQSVLAPVAGVDYNAFSGPGGTGVSLNSSVSASIAREGGGQAEVLFTNTAPVIAYIQSSSQLRGTKVLDVGALGHTRRAGPSLSQQGILAYTHPALVEGSDFAEALADYLLGLGQTPRGYVHAFTLDARADSSYLTDVLALGIGSRVRLAESQTGAANDYYIISEEHWVTANPRQHRVQYKTEPANGSAVWLLGLDGYSELEATTILAPW